MYDFNLLVSCSWGDYTRAREEIKRVLEGLGDKKPLIRRTLAKGIIGVRTTLSARQVVNEVRRVFKEDQGALCFAVKWTPVDAWTYSDLKSIKNIVENLKNRISRGEQWRMIVNKRRYTKHHKMEIIKSVAELIEEKVDLENPDKILCIELVGKYAGVSVITPKEFFSL